MRKQTMYCGVVALVVATPEPGSTGDEASTYRLRRAVLDNLSLPGLWLQFLPDDSEVVVKRTKKRRTK